GAVERLAKGDGPASGAGERRIGAERDGVVVELSAGGGDRGRVDRGGARGIGGDAGQRGSSDHAAERRGAGGVGREGEAAVHRAVEADVAAAGAGDRGGDAQRERARIGERDAAGGRAERGGGRSRGDRVVVELSAGRLHDAAADLGCAAGVGRQRGQGGVVTDRGRERRGAAAVGDEVLGPIDRAGERDRTRAGAGRRVAI